MSSMPEQLEKTSVEPNSRSDSDSDSDSDERAPARSSGQELVVEDLMVEDVSIDGMCGVY